MSHVGFSHFLVAREAAVFFPVTDKLQKLTLPQSKDAVQLCALLVDETYGELASVGSYHDSYSVTVDRTERTCVHSSESITWLSLLVWLDLTPHSGFSQSSSVADGYPSRVLLNILISIDDNSSTA